MKQKVKSKRQKAKSTGAEMKSKVYSIAGRQYRQEVMSVNQIKAFLKLLKELGIGQLLNAGHFDLNMVLDQVIEQNKIEMFLAIILLNKEQTIFDQQNYDENLERFSVCDGNVLAEVVEDFLSCNETWFARLNKQMGKLQAPAAEQSTSTN
jgi:hypothetical protein